MSLSLHSIHRGNQEGLPNSNERVNSITFLWSTGNVLKEYVRLVIHSDTCGHFWKVQSSALCLQEFTFLTCNMQSQPSPRNSSNFSSHSASFLCSRTSSWKTNAETNGATEEYFLEPVSFGYRSQSKNLKAMELSPLPYSQHAMVRKTSTPSFKKWK